MFNAHVSRVYDELEFRQTVVRSIQRQLKYTMRSDVSQHKSIYICERTHSPLNCSSAHNYYEWSCTAVFATRVCVCDCRCCANRVRSKPIIQSIISSSIVADHFQQHNNQTGQARVQNGFTFIARIQKMAAVRIAATAITIKRKRYRFAH